MDEELDSEPGEAVEVEADAEGGHGSSGDGLAGRVVLLGRGLLWLGVGGAPLLLAVQRLGLTGVDSRLFVILSWPLVFGLGATVSALLAADAADLRRRRDRVKWYTAGVAFLSLPLVVVLTFPLTPSNPGGVAITAFTVLLFAPTALFLLWTGRASGDERRELLKAGGAWILMVFAAAVGIGLAIGAPVNVIFMQGVSDPLLLLVLVPAVLVGLGGLYLAVNVGRAFVEAFARYNPLA